MLRQFVSSSRIKTVGWANNVLEVEFHNGSVYQYYNVTEPEYQSFMRASSLGSELSRLDKCHTYRRIH